MVPRSPDGLVAAEAALLLGALAVVYRLDRPALWLAWALASALVAGATLFRLNT